MCSILEHILQPATLLVGKVPPLSIAVDWVGHIDPLEAVKKTNLHLPVVKPHCLGSPVYAHDGSIVLICVKLQMVPVLQHT